MQEGAEPTRADLVAVEMTRRADLFPGTDPRDLDAWARGLLRDPDLHLPPKAQLAPYLRAALRKLAGKVAATPGMVNGSRFSFVHTVTFGMVNDDKINHWASGKTDGKEGVCAPPRSQRQQATGSSELDASDADAEIAEADRKLAADRAKQAAEPKVDPAKMAELTRKVLARFGGGA